MNKNELQPIEGSWLRYNPDNDWYYGYEHYFEEFVMVGKIYPDGRVHHAHGYFPNHSHGLELLKIARNK